MQLKEAPLLAAKGFCMGAADLVPGVSGGTMAFILGIYERLLDAIKSFDKTWLISLLRLDFKTGLSRPHFVFVIPLLLGIGSALLFFTKVVPLPVYIITHPELIYGLFFGLILASIYILMQETGRLNAVDAGFLVVGALAGFWVVTSVPVNTPDSGWFVFLCGAIAICAMILPGISGSFILLLLKKYAYIIGAVGTLDFSILLPFALGCITGLVLFTRFLSWMIRHYYRQSLLVIKGILLASLWVLWPYQERVYVMVHGKDRLTGMTPILPPALDATLLGSLALALTGIIVVLVIHKLAARRA
jgi:putative membrane protein